MKKILFIVILIILVGIYFGKYNAVRYSYQENWNIIIPEPYKTQTLIEYIGAGDVLTFDLLYFKDNDMKKIIALKEFKKYNSTLDEIYVTTIEGSFIKQLNSKDKELFLKSFNKDKLFSKENYYAILEKSTDNRDYIYNLLVLDTYNNILYSVSSNF